MKLFNLLRFARIGALVLCLTASTSFLVSAQPGNSNGASTTRTETRDNDTDWGWLGLLGLLGLAGLLPKRRQVEVHENRTTNRT